MLNSTSKLRGLRRLYLEAVEERLALSATFEPPAFVGLPTIPETEYLPIVIDDDQGQLKAPWDDGGFIDFDTPADPRSNPNGGLGSNDMPDDGSESENGLFDDGTYYGDSPFYDDVQDGATPTQADGFNPQNPLEISTGGLRLAIIVSVDQGQASVLSNNSMERTRQASHLERGGWIAIEPILDRMPAEDGDLQPADTSPIAARGPLKKLTPGPGPNADDETALASESARAAVFEMIGGEPAAEMREPGNCAPAEEAPSTVAPRAADAAQLEVPHRTSAAAEASPAPAIERGAWLQRAVERLDALADSVLPELLRTKSAGGDDPTAWNDLTTATGVVLALGLERALAQQSSGRGLLASARPLRARPSALPRRAVRTSYTCSRIPLKS
jgi:hypothetical protein